MAQEFNTNLRQVTANFLETLEVPFTRRYLKQQMESNPYYPSLYSVSEIFNRYNIENKGLQVEAGQLDELPVPFMAYLRIREIGGKDFVNVTRVTKDAVTYYDGKEKTVSRQEFMDNWQSQIVFLAESNDKTNEKEFDKNKKAEIADRNRSGMLLSGFSLILIYAALKYVISSGNAVASASFLLFTLTGLAVSVLLLIYEVDKSNTFIKNICTAGIKANCDAVLGSKAARLFGISWGEIGFFYFCSLVLFLLLPGISFIEKTPYISFVSLLSAAYIPFSLFYQYKVVRQWCRLCLFVQAVLFLNACWTLRFGGYAFNLSGTNSIFFALCALFPPLLWYALKPILIKARDADKFQAAYKRLYSRQDVFGLTLSDQPGAPGGWQELGIPKGNPGAETVILKVCSPVCGHCNTAHGIFNEILKANDNVRLVTIYNASNDENDFRRFPVRHFLALAEQGNDKQAEEAMDYWYLNEDKNYDTLKQNFPLPEELLERQSAKIEAMRSWCMQAEIEYTPTVYINGRQLPSTFNLSDLKNVFS